jgi:hypothetical protein
MRSLIPAGATQKAFLALNEEQVRQGSTVTLAQLGVKCDRRFISHQLAGVTAESATEAMMASYHMNPYAWQCACAGIVRVGHRRSKHCLGKSYDWLEWNVYKRSASM